MTSWTSGELGAGSQKYGSFWEFGQEAFIVIEESDQ